jgi:molecular chaperone GrpE
MAGPGKSPEPEEEPQVTVRDRRRIDPDTGEVRDVPEAATAASGSALEQQLSERTDDLLRLKAEFDNYRKRAVRDRALAGEVAVGQLLSGLLGSLDDVDRARAHGALEGAFKAVAENLEKALTAAGLERFGQPGEAFDPTRHEALQSVEDPEVSHEVVHELYRAGYAYSGRVLRPAQVVVATPAGPGPDAGTSIFTLDPLTAPLPENS